MISAARRAAMLEHVRAQRVAAKAITGRRPARRQRLPAQLPPKGITLAYFGALRTIAAAARAQIEQHLVRELPALARRSRAGENVHNQVIADVQAAAAGFARAYPSAHLQQIVSTYAQRTSTFQRGQLVRQLKAGLGGVPPLQDRAAGQRLAAFVTENVEKIRALVAAYFADVQARTLRALRPRAHGDDEPGTSTETEQEDYVLEGGISLEQFTLDLGRRGDATEGKFAQAADNSVRGLFGDLNITRQRELGLDDYTWRTMEDDRVRPEHAALDGKQFSYSAPPAIGNPGEPYGCRCQPEPVLANLQT